MESFHREIKSFCEEKFIFYLDDQLIHRDRHVKS